MKRTNLRGLLLCLLCAALLSGLCACGKADRKENPADTARLAYAAGRVICVGDSLTEGSCFGQDLDGAAIEQSYPCYLARMLSAEVCNAGHAGCSASAWYAAYADACDWRGYDTVILWLGTNEGPTDTLAEDVLPFSDPADYAQTETGFYCRLIEKIRGENPDCLILLLNVYASKGDVEEANRAIAAIAERYALPLLDMSDLGAPEHPEYHAGSAQNPHLGKTGNLVVASRIVDALQRWFAADPARCEYGLTVKPAA